MTSIALCVAMEFGVQGTAMAEPGIPTNISALPTGATIRLTWQPGIPANPPLRYRIYRGVDSTALALLDSSTLPIYEDVTTPPTVRAFFRVSEVDSTGAEGSPSALVNARPDGLEARYSFTGTMDDLSGNGRPLTNYGGVPTGDRLANPTGAYAFNGSSTYAIRVGGFTMGQQVTMAAWIRPNPSSFIYSVIAAIGDSSQSLRLSYLPFLQKAGFDGWLVSTDIGIVPQSTPGTLPLNAWTHVAGTLDGNTWTLYINGAFVQSLEHQREIYDNLNLAVSKNPGPYIEDYFPGAIDDVNVYSRALSATEIDSLYHVGRWTSASATHAAMTWGLNGLPLALPSTVPSLAFPGLVGQPYRIVNGVYTRADSVKTGEGYWTMYSTAGTSSVSGVEIDSTVTSTTLGSTTQWILLSGPSVSVPVSRAEISGNAVFVGSIYSYTGSAYVAASAFEPGQAYWALLQPTGGGGEVTITIR